MPSVYIFADVIVLPICNSLAQLNRKPERIRFASRRQPRKSKSGTGSGLGIVPAKTALARGLELVGWLVKNLGWQWHCEREEKVCRSILVLEKNVVF